MAAEAQTFLHGAAPMPNRLSPGTFLSLMRHPRTGQFDEGFSERIYSQPKEDPQDCVKHAQSVDPEMTVMIGYDIHGVVRVKVEVAERDAAWWERLMIRYMRWRFGRPMRLVR
jgi:hypothetical protein